MRKLIAETFIALIILVLVATGLSLARGSLVEIAEDVRTAWEAKRIQWKIIGRLKDESSDGLRAIAMDVLLWDETALLNWLETKSILTDAQKRSQVEECRRRLEERRNHSSRVLRKMGARELMKLIRAEIRNRDAVWRRGFLEYLQKRLPTYQPNDRRFNEKGSNSQLP